MVGSSSSLAFRPVGPTCSAEALSEGRSLGDGRKQGWRGEIRKSLSAESHVET
jgi:hypothetical protein